MTDLDARRLAGQLAETLRDLRDRGQVQYLLAASAIDDALVEAEPSFAPAAPAPAVRLPVVPAVVPAVATAVVSPTGPAADDDADRRRALRDAARTWSPGTKLEYLREHNVGDCQRCPLARTRTKLVFGVGSPEATLMFVGEAPGADEDRQGEPFVGRAGQRLTAWIEALGLRRGDVYIANVLKCRPPGNRDPRPEEVDKCAPFLRGQIRAIRPRVIVALGRHAGMLLSRREDMTLRAMRNAQLTYDAGTDEDGARLLIPLVVTYHPAYVLRQEGAEVGEGRANADEVALGDVRRAFALAGHTSEPAS